LIKQSKLVPISTGSSDLDEMLAGGILPGELTEIYGEAGAGKTQLMFSLAINTMISRDPGGVCWIDTEGAFSAARLVEIATTKGFDPPEEVLDNIAVMRAPTHEIQMTGPSLVYALVSTSQIPYKLVVIDSIISTFRAEFNGRGELSVRQQKLGQHLDEWKKVAQNLGVAIVFSNQICADPGNMFVPNAYKPVGGNILAHAAHTRLEIKGATKKEGKRVVKIIKSSKLANNQIEVQIELSGIGNFQ
jgi:RecA/RadA recombinase